VRKAGDVFRREHLACENKKNEVAAFESEVKAAKEAGGNSPSIRYA